MIFRQAPFIRFFLPFLIGIFVGIRKYIDLPEITSIAIICIFSVLLALVAYKKIDFPYRYRWVYGIFLNILLFVFGFNINTLKTEITDIDHFSGYLTRKNQALVRLIEAPVEKEKTIKAVVKVLHLKNKNWIVTKGKAIIYIAKDSISKQLHYGDELLVNTSFSEIKQPQNPDEFDYKQYLYYHQITHQAYVSAQTWTKINSNKGFQLVGLSYQLRDYLLKILQHHQINGDEFAVAGALLLGYEDQLDQEIINAYSSSGALHVLSVSGMHVAIVYIVFSWLLGFLDKIKYGVMMKAIVLLLFLWFYALLTGFSASVLRSAAMFSFVVIANAFNRKTNIYNTLAISAFVLLLINPFYIMDVGFQLSYLAVIGIVFVYPKIDAWLFFKNKIAYAIWKIVAISLAAQIATFPLSLYYFHQFPTYFLFSNLIVVPVSTFILYGGILLFFVDKIVWLGTILGQALWAITWFLNSSVKFIEKLPYAIIEGISIESFETILIYLVIVFVILYFLNKRIKYVQLFLCCTIVLCAWQLIEKHIFSRQNQLVVYNIPKTSAYDFISAQKNYLVADSVFLANPQKIKFHIQHHWWKLGVNQNYYHELENKPDSILFNKLKAEKNIIQLRDKIVLLPTNELLEKNSMQNIQADYIIISKNINMNKNNFIYSEKPVLVVLDSSIPSFQLKKWKDHLAEKKNVSLYSVSENGAFVVNL